MCLLSLREGVVAEDRALMLQMRMGHPPFESLKTCYSSMFGRIEVDVIL